MKLLPDWLKNGYLKIIDPVANWLVRRGVHPNTITVIGTLCTVAGGIIYATGHIKTGGWFLGMTALFDVLDGTVARRSNMSSTFGAFLDSTLDRVADGALLGGLAVLVGAFLVIVGVPMIVTMLVAALTVHLPYGFSSIKLLSVTDAGPRFGPPGYETSLLYVVCLLILMWNGAGPFSVENLIARRLNTTAVSGREDA